MFRVVQPVLSTNLPQATLILKGFSKYFTNNFIDKTVCWNRQFKVNLENYISVFKILIPSSIHHSAMATLLSTWTHRDTHLDYQWTALRIPSSLLSTRILADTLATRFTLEKFCQPCASRVLSWGSRLPKTFPISFAKSTLFKVFVSFDKEHNLLLLPLRSVTIHTDNIKKNIRSVKGHIHTLKRNIEFKIEGVLNH